MECHFCDLCNSTLNDTRNVLLIMSEKDFGVSKTGTPTVNPRSSYEICPSCTALLHKIFTLKKKRVNEVLESINDIYKLPAKTKKMTKKQKRYKIIRVSK